MDANTILKQGDTLRRRISLKYIGNNAPVNLAGCTGYSQLRQQPGGDLIANGTVTLGGADGTVVVVYSKTQTASLQLGDYGFDVRLESDGDRRTIYTENIKVVKPYTERA